MSSGLAYAFSHLEHVADYVYEIRSRKRLLINAVALRLAELDVELQAADAREIELALVEEHPAKQVPGGQNCRRIAGAHLAIDFENRIARRLDGIFLERLADDRADIVAFGEEDLNLRDARFDYLLPLAAVSSVLASAITSPVSVLTTSSVKKGAFDLLRIDGDGFDLGFSKRVNVAARKLLARSTRP